MKVQMRYCRPCGRYVTGCIHAPRPKIYDRETSWGWVVLAFFLGLGIVFYLGSCA